MKNPPSYEYELLHQFEVVFRDGEHKTQAATRDYSKIWENVIDDFPEEGVTPVLVYRMNGEVCAAIAGIDDLISNEECAMEIARLAAAMQRERVLAKIEVLEEVYSDIPLGPYEEDQLDYERDVIRMRLNALRSELTP